MRISGELEENSEVFGKLDGKVWIISPEIGHLK